MINEVKSKEFNVAGAGLLRLSENADHITAQTAGFSIGVSWTEFPFCGGVIGRDEAKRLADFIYEQLAKFPESEKETIRKFYKNLDE